jgi:ubiquinone/menaquinone biosynthesis C-methylase UbiE
VEQPQTTKFAKRDYTHVATFYDVIARLWSFGLIRKSKMVELDYMPAGSRVLFLGVGTGEEAVEAAARGLKVTTIDLAGRMTRRLDRALAARGLKATTITGDAMTYEPAERFDVVCGNYFFNLFASGDMEQVLLRTSRLVRPGGRMMIADMAPQSGLLAPFGWLYLKAGLSFFWVLGLASQHPIYDYADIASKHGFRVEAMHDFGPSSMPLYRAVVLVPPGPEETA